jgi:GAF domain-containing protein
MGHTEEHIVELVDAAGYSKDALYDLLAAQADSLFDGEPDFIANMANCAALLYNTLPDLNWAGFYLLRGDVLVLGPFQGKPACIRIAMGTGVCGAAAQRRETVVVENVNEFPGHIACDSASQSEVVVPILTDGRVIGVLDLDSPNLRRFDMVDAAGLEAIVSAFVQHTDIPAL